MGAIVQRQWNDPWNIERACAVSTIRDRMTREEVEQSLARGALVLHDAAEQFRVARTTVMEEAKGNES